LAKKRLPLIQSLLAIPAGAKDEEKQRRVLEIWDQAVLGTCHEAAPWRPYYQRFHAAEEVVRQITQALEAGQLADAARWLESTLLQDVTLPPKLAQAVQAARDQIQQAELAKRQALINVFRDSRRTDFADLFDAALITEICRQSRHHQPLVSQWMETEILPLARIGLTCDPAAALTRDEQSQLTCRWTWPAPRFSNTCRLVICKQRPRPQIPPDNVPAEHSAAITRDQFFPAASHQIAIQPEWDGCHVIVWAVVDLGFQVFYSEPLELGPVPAASKPAAQPPRRWSLFRGWRSEKKAPAEEEPGAGAAGEQSAETVASVPPPAPEPPPETK
jgi:hypothetical protein